MKTIDPQCFHEKCHVIFSPSFPQHHPKKQMKRTRIFRNHFLYKHFQNKIRQKLNKNGKEAA